jgi:RNA polymerase sigma-70 factor (ECF subfamily)
VFEGAFHKKDDVLYKTNERRYDEYQSHKMSDAEQYNTYIGVYKDYKDKIYSFFYYRTAHNSHLAEDLTSDTFTKAYEKFHTYDDSYAMSTWLYRIARNTLIDYARKEGDRKFLELDEHLEDSEGLSFIDTIDQEIDIERIEALIEELPKKQAKMIRMKYFEYKDTSEIAESEEMEETAVRKNISRGIQKLQGLLATLMLFFTNF